MSPDLRDDADLLASCRSEPQAFAVFYERHVDWVMRFFARRVRDREAVADLVAETFALALVSVPRFDPARGTGGAWLFGIASHQLSRWRRRGEVERRASGRLQLSVPAISDDEWAALVGDDAAARLLDDLPPDLRFAVEARVVDDRSYEDIGGELGLSAAAVRQRVSRGLAALRRRAQTADKE